MPGLGRIAEQHSEEQERGGEDVVVVVGDAAGELADNLHFLRVEKLGFELSAFGNVLEDTGELPGRGRKARSEKCFSREAK